MKELCFVHIGKTGGNSLHKHFKDFLKQTENKYIESLIQVHGNKFKNVLNNYQKVPSGTYKVKIKYQLNDSIILWVRDPISRLISCLKNGLKKKNKKISNELFYNKTDDDLKLFFRKIPHANQNISHFFYNTKNINETFKKKFFYWKM